MIIDCHTHVFSPRLKQNRRQYIDRDACFAVLYSAEKARLATAEELIESMDAAGIDVSVIANIGWTTHQLCAETNDYILESITRYPDRLIGFCAVQPKFLRESVAEIERCARAGARGIGELRPDTQMFNLTDDEAMPVFVETLLKHRLALLIHASEPAGHQYPGKGATTPQELYPFITRYPSLTTICAHWGGGLPFYALMPEVSEAMKNVYFDTAASPFLYRPRIYDIARQLVGADKILFGSDYPLMAQSRPLREISDAGLAEGDKNLILSGNARRLFGI
jgi:predicted TIM-barrel fold metal-dependent hydrolase